MNRKIKNQAGFTLIELMVTLAVIIITLTVGIPAFNTMVANNRAVATSNNLVTALNLARAEAISRGVPVSICGNNGSNRCAGNWGTGGWIVFEDTTANMLGGSGTIGEIDADTDIIRIWEAPSGRPTITGEGNSAFFIRWHPEGWMYEATGIAALTTNFTLTDVNFDIVVTFPECTGNQVRTITVTRSGRAKTALSACP